CQQYDKSPPTF
nr:immunoglobulin light chain junction region [Macaca mulatta]MOV77916.1 immunoglobulin light chain junction region [Macaca mulatta]MOV78221.1 immunoglobulin light chain junction region [Macaca mulatta]MOV78285.1 immunoglobulin light chain junction region [Macaca mulatta]MOV79496.1 immunoglobulin light chain junction region [Macaca mulatta]